MPGCSCLPEPITSTCENLDLREKRNFLASSIAGLFFFSGWWFAIDVASQYPTEADMSHVYHICGVFGTLAMFMINTVSNGQVRGDAYTDGCMGPYGARIWLFLGFVMGFGSLIGSSYILFGKYVMDDIYPHSWPGVAIFLQCLFIFIGNIIFKFGRSEDQWG